MGVNHEVDPDDARTTAEFASLLRELRARSGRTRRQLAERAARHGEALPRGAVSVMLRGRALPRHELLAAYVRACGDGERLTEWLEARDRLAAREGATDAGAAENAGSGSGSGEGRRPTEGNDPSRAGRPSWLPDPRRFTAPVSLVAVALLVSTVWLLASGGGTGDGGDRVGGTGSGPTSDTADPEPPPAGPPRGTVRIRPLSAPGLCLTDGRPAESRYEHPVAVQRRCDRATGTRTTLPPVPGSDARHIEWRGDGSGARCLKVLAHGAGAGLLAPDAGCAEATAFRFEPAGAGAHTYVLRTAGGRCVTVKGGSKAAGTEVRARRCAEQGSDGAHGRAQLFRVEAVS